LVSQTLAPVELAGFNLLFDEFDGTVSDQLGLAGEYRITDPASKCSDRPELLC
jgi:hypothetical protein